MSYKVKSLVYLVCFVASSFVYYSTEKDLENTNGNTEIATLNINEKDSENTNGNTEIATLNLNENKFDKIVQIK